MNKHEWVFIFLFIFLIISVLLFLYPRLMALHTLANEFGTINEQGKKKKFFFNNKEKKNLNNK